MDEIIIGLLSANLAVQGILWRFIWRTHKGIEDVWNVMPSQPAPAAPNTEELFQG